MDSQVSLYLLLIPYFQLHPGSRTFLLSCKGFDLELDGGGLAQKTDEVCMVQDLGCMRGQHAGCSQAGTTPSLRPTDLIWEVQLKQRVILSKSMFNYVKKYNCIPELVDPKTNYCSVIDSKHGRLTLSNYSDVIRNENPYFHLKYYNYAERSYKLTKYDDVTAYDLCVKVWNKSNPTSYQLPFDSSATIFGLRSSRGRLSGCCHPRPLPLGPPISPLFILTLTVPQRLCIQFSLTYIHKSPEYNPKSHTLRISSIDSTRKQRKIYFATNFTAQPPCYF